MGKVGAGASIPGVKAYQLEGTLAHPSSPVAYYKATVAKDGVLFTTVSNTTTDGTADGYGTSVSRILLNGKKVAASSGSWSGNVSDKRMFGSSAAANLVVHAGDNIGLYCENSAGHAIYTATVISTAGELHFTRT